MTKAEAILMDKALLRCPRNTPFGFQGPMYNILIGEHDQHPEDVYNEMVQLSLYQSAKIRKLLLIGII